MERCTIKETKSIKKNLILITKLIYEHFIDLSQYSTLKHTQQEIFNLIQKDEFKGFFVYNNKNRLIGYLIGEIMITDDGRRIYYISYLYTDPAYRKHGIASSLINLVIKQCNESYGINFITLTCNSKKSNVCNLYKKLGFKKDIVINTVHPFIVLTYQMD